MGKLSKIAAAALIPFGMIAFSSSAQASATQTTCTLDSFTLTSVAVGAGPNLLSQSYDSTYCVGVFTGGGQAGNDDANGLSEPDPNIGVFNEGILNGEGNLFDGLEFIDASDLQDIDGIGGMNDPGWIHLAHMDADLDPTYDSIEDLDLADILNLTFDCTSGDPGSCTGGTWSLEVDPVAFALVQAILGPNSFDNLALSIKASNSFAVYDLDFGFIFGEENNPALNFTTAYNFTGTFNTNDFLNNQGRPQGISHMNLWARDPINTVTEVPEPGTLAMFGLGLIGLSLGRQIKRRKA